MNYGRIQFRCFSFRVLALCALAHRHGKLRPYVKPRHHKCYCSNRCFLPLWQVKTSAVIKAQSCSLLYPPIQSLPRIKCGVLGGLQPVLEAGITVFKSKCASAPSFMHVARGHVNINTPLRNPFLHTVSKAVMRASSVSHPNIHE